MEDWRYIKFRNDIGGNGKRYWLMSLIGFHMTPTLLVFFCLAPTHNIFLNKSKVTYFNFVRNEFGNPYDFVSVMITFNAILIAYFADKQLSDFRLKQYGKKAFLDHAAGSKKCCRDGLWNWSRHPNYFGEVLFWVGLALMSISANPSALSKPMIISEGYLPIWKTCFGGALDARLRLE